MPGDRAPFVPVEWRPSGDQLDRDFPMRLTTGRRLDSYNTGVQTAALRSPMRRGESLDLCPEDAARLHVTDGERSCAWCGERGQVEVPVTETQPAAGAHVHDVPLPG